MGWLVDTINIVMSQLPDISRHFCSFKINHVFIFQMDSLLCQEAIVCSKCLEPVILDKALGLQYIMGFCYFSLPRNHRQNIPTHTQWLV